MKIQQRIETTVREILSPSHLDVINESHKHSVPAGSETHFKLIIVSETFEGKTLVGRHRTVHELLRKEFADGVHALALHTYTPQEWQRLQQAPISPNCRGGSKSI